MDYTDNFISTQVNHSITEKQPFQKEDGNDFVRNYQDIPEQNENNHWQRLNELENQGMRISQGQPIDTQYIKHNDTSATFHNKSSHIGRTPHADVVHFKEILNFKNENIDFAQTNNDLPGNSYESASKFNRMQNLPMLPEDLRISKIIRRLMIENNRKAAIDLCKKLENAVRNQSNVNYICRSFDILFDNMITVLRQCPTDCLEKASSILGIMGYINRYDFPIYKTKFTKAYAKYKNLRRHLMMALKTTLKCDAVNLDLKTYGELLLELLKYYLENSEITENFISITETIAEFSKNYKTSFQIHFKDIVDIIIGWHLEVDQPAELKRHCSKILQHLAEYFLNELDFTFGLLGQFIEDIDTCYDDILSNENSTVAKEQTGMRVGGFIGAFTSIVKALAYKGINLNEFVASANILINAKDVVNKVTLLYFDMSLQLSEETVVNVNEFYTMVLHYDKSAQNLNALENIFQLQLNRLSAFNNHQQSSFLYMALTLVRQYRTQLPIRFITLLLQTDSQDLQDLKLTYGLKTYRLYMKIYHEILVIKNVPLLQEGYRHILKDINKIVATLNDNQATQDTMLRCEMLFNFYLASLTAIACQTSSIIGMYALKPSILELLIKNCQSSNCTLWSKYPTLHKALLELIIDHCKKNHNFRQSSRLLHQQLDSPSSENFALILKFLAELLKWHVSEVIFKWLENILHENFDDLEILIENDDFLKICENITLSAAKHPEICSNVLELLLKYPKIHQRLLSNIRDVALCVAESSNTKVANVYCKILARLPLDICLTENYDKQLYSKNKQKLLTLYQWHKSSACFNGLRPKYFKAFLNSLDPNFDSKTTHYASFIEKSSCNIHRDHFVEYLKTLQYNQLLLSYHLQYEAARYCVQQKLRTTLGKPQDTFLGIEAIIMKYARYLAEKEGLPSSHKNLVKVIEVQENCRMLLGFLECLEKHIYNASEGTAYAMLPAEKPAKTFFRVNAATCKEWFKRIRPAVNLISIHSMEPSLVIRYAEIILQMVENHDNLTLIDRTVTSMVWALYNNGESDTLCGLAIWLKSKHGKRFEWIQYVAEQTNGHLEKAALGYLNTLRDENHKSMDLYMKEFIQRQLADCLYHTGRWSEIHSINQENLYSKHHLKILENLYQSVDSQKFNCESHELKVSLIELTEWPEDMVGSERNKYTPKLDTYSYYEVMEKVRDACITRSNTDQINNGVNESVSNCVLQAIRECLLRSYEPGFNNNQLNELVIINHISQKFQCDEYIKISNDNSSCDIKFSSLLLSKCLNWSLICDEHNTKQHCNLLLSLASKVRTENNLNYCQSLLSKFFKLKQINLPISNIAQQLKMNQLNIDYNDKVLVHGVEELVKCLYAQTNSISDALELGSACCVQILELQKKTHANEKSSLPESISNLLLNMADWLTMNRLNNIDLSNGEQFLKLQQLLPEMSCCNDSNNTKSNIVPSTEYYVGKFLNASVLCNQNSGEAWFSYGNWCYRWGKKEMESAVADQSSAVPLKDLRNIKLTKRSIYAIEELLKDKYDTDVIEQIIGVLNSHIMNAINDDNTDLDTSSHFENTAAILERELSNVCPLDEDELNAIFSIWRQAQKGVYSFYEESTRAYFKYLAIESEAVSKRSNVSNSDNNEVEDCTFVTATLRILRLLVKHAIGLQEVLEEGLRSTPLRPWKAIVPQLFSRLNHHEPYVRKSLSELLSRLAVIQPQLIIFPAVVGAKEELKHRNTGNQSQLSNCFGSLLSSLSPNTVLQVQLLVKELRRITLLWDEYWIHNLSQLYAEYSPLYNALESEMRKCQNSELMQSKCEVFRQHLLTDFKKIAAVSENEPETSYERSFQERFGTYIDAVSKELDKSKEEAKHSECWQKIKQLYSAFQQKSLRGNSSMLCISEISPVLANMHNTSIDMPGVDTYEQSPVFIKSVDVTAFIFVSTKTKPKKLSFFGSNGQRYTYLFKGHEDLHLDERIMQFLAISNSMMARSYGSKSKTDCFKANHYSVIPLGSRSGLIRWVDNCFPLFAIYKKWQQRDALLKQQQKERQSSRKRQEQVEDTPGAITAPRPSELFYNKLTPILAENNLKITDPRRQWPLSVLKRVLKELSAETPKDLLAKEIWCYSANAVEWRKSVRRYSLSLAVMSIIGYVIGLGDRHLDNVLIKLHTGEILHIDYSICFEKGKTLRVPEKVPFRMTQNIKDALGLAGIEGVFRLACTHVLRILRKERETLLTLLEAFVYDPLVDWAVSDDGTTNFSRRTSAHTASNIIALLGVKTSPKLSPKSLQKTKKQEVDLSKQAIMLRVSEIKENLLKYKSEFDLQINDVNSHVENMLGINKKILQLEQERDNYSKQQAMVREIEALGSAQASHAFVQRYNVYKHDLENFTKAKSMVQKTLSEFDMLLTTYFDMISNPEIINYIKVNCDDNDFMQPNACEFDAIKDLLLGSNWNNVYVQASFNRHDMENAFVQTHRSCLECRDLLTFYNRVMQFYPRSQLQSYRLMQYKHTFEDLMGIAEKSGNGFQVDSKQNIDYCTQYFECMKIVAKDLQNNIFQAKQNLEERKQQMIINSSTTLKSINDFISLNPSYNSKIVIICMLRHATQVSQIFQRHEQTLIKNRDHFLPNKQLGFMQLLKTFIDLICRSCMHVVPNNEILHYFITALECICNLRENITTLADKLFAVFMMDNNTGLQDVLKNFEKDMNVVVLENDLQLCGLLKNVNVAIEKLKTPMKVLQEKIVHIQEVEEGNLTDDIELASWNTNISNIMGKLTNDLKLTLVKNVKQCVDSLQMHNLNNIFDIRKIRCSIDDLLLDLESNLFEGLMLYVIQNVNKNISNSLVPLEIINESDVSQADLLCGNLYAALEHESLIESDNFEVLYHLDILEKYKQITTAYYWLNEQYLNNRQDSCTFITPKNAFVARIHEIYQVLKVWKTTMLKIQADLDLHRNSFRDLMQSLSPTEDLTLKKQQFEDNINFINQRYNFFMNLCIKLSEHAAVILKFEMCPDEQSFENLVKAFSEARQQWLHSNASITAVEHDLVQLLDPEDKIDQCWLENASALLDEMIFSTQKKLSDMEKHEEDAQNHLLADGQNLETLSDSTLRLDLRQLLKVLAKLCKIVANSDNDVLCQDLRNTQQNLKLLQLKLKDLRAQLFSRVFDSRSLKTIQEKINELNELYQRNSEDLNLLLVRVLRIDADTEPNSIASKTPSQNCMGNKEVFSYEIGEQKRNAYAVSVWKRVRMKLEGRDPDHNRRISVAEQVDFVIREATNEENLASLYEGWTPWV